MLILRASLFSRPFDRVKAYNHKSTAKQNENKNWRYFVNMTSICLTLVYKKITGKKSKFAIEFCHNEILQSWDGMLIYTYMYINVYCIALHIYF